MENNKNQMRQYLLSLIDRDDKDYVKKVIDSFSVSKSSIYNYVKQLAEENVIRKNEKKKTKYELVKTSVSFVYSNKEKLTEDIIYKNDISPLFDGLEQNVIHIWYYGFCEMMNNAIDHSGASSIKCTVIKDEINTTVVVSDDGEGIFEHIHKYILETTGEDLPLGECVGFLFPGRFTTNREKHSGEGIFFTSYIMDKFTILSGNQCFTRDSFTDREFETATVDKNGTTVIMTLSNNSTKKIIDVFNRFSSEDEGFYKTLIPMSHLFTNGFPVSRSEARRLVMLIKDFKEVTLDFSGIENVGQAFVHEFFVVQKDCLANTAIEMINQSDDVRFMINRQKRN